MVVDNKCIPLKCAAKRLRVHISTCYRWRIRGVAGIRLRTKRIGGKRYVELAELDRFIGAVTAAADGERPSPARHSAKRDQQIAAAEAELAAIGISSQRSKDKE